MSSPARLPRRQFLWGSVAALGGAVIPACGCKNAPPPRRPPTTARPTSTTRKPPPPTTRKPPPTTARPTTTRPTTTQPTTTTAPPPPPTPPSAGVRLIGEQYLSAHPGTKRSTLEASLPAGVSRTAGADVQLGQAVGAIAADFANGRRDRLDGWWFSRTELRICALGVLRDR